MNDEEKEPLPGETEKVIDTSRARKIFDEAPQDEEVDEVEPGTFDKDDFEGDSEPPPPSDAPPDPAQDDPGDQGPDEPEILEAEDETETERLKRENKSAEVREKVVKVFIKSSTIVAFIDMILSRAGSAALGKSQKKDWMLDPYEKEIMVELLDATIEEEGIHFWPAKIWLFIAAIVVYALKSLENWQLYYSEEGQLKMKPQENLERHTSKHAAELIELEILEKDVMVAEKKAKLQERLDEAEKAMRPSPFKPEPTDKELIRKAKKANSEHVYNIRNPYTNAFMKKEAYVALMKHIQNGGEVDIKTGEAILPEEEKPQEVEEGPQDVDFETVEEA